MSPRKVKEQLRVIEQYRGLVMKLAWEYWRRLPVYSKVWIDPDDLIEEAYLFILRKATKTYDKKRASQMTFLWCGIGNLFKNFANAQQTKKRFGWSVSLEELECAGMGARDSGIAWVEAYDAAIRTYRQVSPECRCEMKQWFGPERRKVKRSGEALKLYREFYQTAHTNGLTIDDCRQLIQSGGLWLG
jgi:hypothetical protein